MDSHHAQAINIGLIVSINDQSFIPIYRIHRSMSDENDQKFPSLQIKTCTPKPIIKTTMKQQLNFELILQMLVWHVNLSLANSQAIIFWISVGNLIRNQ